MSYYHLEICIVNHPEEQTCKVVKDKLVPDQWGEIRVIGVLFCFRVIFKEKSKTQNKMMNCLYLNYFDE